MKIDVSNCIIIFDEGHNINGVCETAASFELSVSEIKRCVGELVEAGQVRLP